MNSIRLALAALATACGSAVLGDPTQGLEEGWRFSPGDDPEWSAPDYDDAAWGSIRVDRAWEEAGHPGLDGYGWYRLRFRVEEALLNSPQLARTGMLLLRLGRIDDVDQAWLNGAPIGQTGSFPEDYASQWAMKRTYAVPAHRIRAGEDNVLAVRVYDGDGRGGMYAGPHRLELARWTDLVRVVLGRGRGDGVLEEGPNGLLRAQLQNRSAEGLSGEITWVVETDEGAVVGEASREASLPAKSVQDFPCSIALTDPGFYRVTCCFTRDGTDEQVRHTQTRGYKPEAVRADLTRRADFDAFWEQTLAELAATPPEFRLTPIPGGGSATHDLYEVEMRSLGGVRVGGWYQRPKAPGRHPALLRVPGYTMNMRPIDVDLPLAVFSFNIRGHGNSQKDVSGFPVDYWTRGLDDKSGYFYQGAFADCVRAVDFLASRAEIDPSRIAITGASQGGGLSLVATALDRRISCCAPDIPFLCDWRRYFKTTTWPEIDGWVKAEPDRSWESMLETLSYFDALNFADRIDRPVLLGAGLQDGVCPAGTVFSVYNRIDADKQYHLYHEAEHWVGPAHETVRWEWLRRQLRLAE